jgi:hypothetical protein
MNQLRSKASEEPEDCKECLRFAEWRYLSAVQRYRVKPEAMVSDAIGCIAVSRGDMNLVSLVAGTYGDWQSMRKEIARIVHNEQQA